MSKKKQVVEEEEEREDSQEDMGDYDIENNPSLANSISRDLVGIEEEDDLGAFLGEGEDEEEEEEVVPEKKPNKSSASPPSKKAVESTPPVAQKQSRPKAEKEPKKIQKKEEVEEEADEAFGDFDKIPGEEMEDIDKPAGDAEEEEDDTDAEEDAFGGLEEETVETPKKSQSSKTSQSNGSAEDKKPQQQQKKASAADVEEKKKAQSKAREAQAISELGYVPQDVRESQQASAKNPEKGKGANSDLLPKSATPTGAKLPPAPQQQQQQQQPQKDQNSKKDSKSSAAQTAKKAAVSSALPQPEELVAVEIGAPDTKKKKKASPEKSTTSSGDNSNEAAADDDKEKVLQRKNKGDYFKEVDPKDFVFNPAWLFMPMPGGALQTPWDHLSSAYAFPAFYVAGKYSVVLCVGRNRKCLRMPDPESQTYKYLTKWDGEKFDERPLSFTYVDPETKKKVSTERELLAVETDPRFLGNKSEENLNKRRLLAKQIKNARIKIYKEYPDKAKDKSKAHDTNVKKFEDFTGRTIDLLEIEKNFKKIIASGGVTPRIFSAAKSGAKAKSPKQKRKKESAEESEEEENEEGGTVEDEEEEATPVESSKKKQKVTDSRKKQTDSSKKASASSSNNNNKGEEPKDLEDSFARIRKLLGQIQDNETLDKIKLGVNTWLDISRSAGCEILGSEPHSLSIHELGTILSDPKLFIMAKFIMSVAGHK